MDIDELLDMNDSGDGKEDGGKSRLNNVVAVTIALLATFMGVTAVKGGNIAQAMQAAQANKIDYWSWYQARNIREEVLRATSVELAMQARSQTHDLGAVCASRAAEFERLANEQGSKKAELQKEAEGFEKEYENLNQRDDQLDLSDASISIAIALLAVTALTGRRWLFFFALAPSVFGVIMGLAGFFGWPIHLALLSQWLGA